MRKKKQDAGRYHLRIALDQKMTIYSLHLILKAIAVVKRILTKVLRSLALHDHFSKQQKNQEQTVLRNRNLNLDSLVEAKRRNK